jgi:DMSO/TMAO reductase YedYZ heme-binding membrane subunit
MNAPHPPTFGHEARPTPDHHWRHVLRVAGAVMIFSVVWLYLRRFGAPIADVYVKLLFASVPVTGIVLIGASFVIGPLAHFWPGRWASYLPLRKHYGLLGIFFVSFHVFWALARLTPAHYPQFFGAGDAFTAAAELSMLAGVASLMLFAIDGVISIPSVEERMRRESWRAAQRLGYLALALAMLHFLLLKWKGWIAIGLWPYALPPLSLLLFVFLLLVFALRVAALLSPGTSGGGETTVPNVKDDPRTRSAAGTGGERAATWQS